MPTAADGVAIQQIVAAVQRQLDDDFAALSERPDGVRAAMRIVCGETGRVGRGDVFVCHGEPQTEFELDEPAVVFAVLDDDGTVAWNSATEWAGAAS